MSLTITIDLFDHSYLSIDGGYTWEAVERELSNGYFPVMLGDADLNHIPFHSDNPYWRFVYYSKNRSAGVAVDSAANIYCTGNGDVSWQKWVDYRFPIKDRLQMGLRMCWPAKKFDCMAVSQDLRVYLCWEDPWIMRGSKTHLIYSGDDAKSWHYRCLGDAFPWINIAPTGQLMISSKDYSWLSLDAGQTWEKRKISIDWGDHSHAGLRWTAFQRIGFRTEMEAYAITPTWIENANEKMAQGKMAVLKSKDGYRHWDKVAILPLPESHNSGSSNLDAMMDIRVTEKTL